MGIAQIYHKQNKILLVGPYPPPIGGVSVHLYRLGRILNNNGHQVDVFDTSKYPRPKIIKSLRLFSFVFLSHYDVIHLHIFSDIYFFILFMLKFIKKFSIYYTDHNYPIFEKKSTIVKSLRRKYIENLDCLILVNEHIFDYFKRNDVKSSKNVTIQNAFLPPPIEEEIKILQLYSDDTKEFIRLHRPLIIANGWQIDFYEGVDLYGLDLCVELTCRLKQHFPKVGLLFALANELANNQYIDQMKKRIHELNIQNNFHFMTGQKELWPLFKRADLMIRPTLTDGDALSVREALFFNCPVIASNVVKRPRGTICFKSRDINDLYRCAYQVLSANNYASSM